MLARFISAILVGLVLMCTPAITNVTTASEQRAILVTGASAGIVRNVAEQLAVEGNSSMQARAKRPTWHP
jgi:hypothetical protein